MLYTGRNCFICHFFVFLATIVFSTGTMYARNVTPISGKSPKHTYQAKRVLRKLNRTSRRVTPFLGHQDALLSGQSWMISYKDTLYETSDIYNVCGRYPYVLGLDLGFIEMGGEENIDRVRVWQREGAAKAHNRRGGIITVSWHMCNPVTDSTAWDCTAGNVVARILNDSVIRDKYYSWLDIGAGFLNKLVDDRGRKIPVLFRPFHESNINGFWWSGKSCSDEEYIALWKLTFNYLAVKKGMRQLIWVFSPYNMQTEEEISARYPGDEYVDVIGFERYQLDAKTLEDGAKRFAEGASHGIDVTLNFAKPRKKIVALTETGYTGVKYDKWWTDGLGKAIKNKRIAYVHLWRNGYSQSYYFGPCPKSASCDNFICFLDENNVRMLNYIVEE